MPNYTQLPIAGREDKAPTNQNPVVKWGALHLITERPWSFVVKCSSIDDLT